MHSRLVSGEGEGDEQPSCIRGTGATLPLRGMTNHEYEKLCDKFLYEGDDAVTHVYCRLWNNYCDLREHRMGMRHGMTREGRRMAARWIMFLRSGRPYEYPTPGCLMSLFSVLTFGIVRRAASLRRIWARTRFGRTSAEPIMKLI